MTNTSFHTANSDSSVAMDSALLVAAVESAAVGVAITDPRLPDNPVIYVNSAFTRMTGYTSADSVGINCRFLQGPETNRETVARIRDAISNGRGCREVLLNYTKEGQSFWNELTIAPVFSPEGEVMSFVGFQSDVTARVEAETESRLARAEAERANIAKSEFLSRMSHELRTPLNAILGFAQLMEMEALDDETKRNTEYILSAGRHLLKLINEVLDMARIESGRVSLEVEDVPLSWVLDEATALIAPLARQRQLKLTQPSLDENVIVRADHQRLVQILLNLLSNAVKYNVEGGRIRVSCREFMESNSAAKSYWRIEVSDDGPGLPPEKRERLFQPFERAGAEDSTIPGTGLELALSQRLALAMNGELGLEPFQAGVGSTFWVSLPTGSAMENTKAADVEIALPSTASDVQRQSHCVLYIEDNVANFELVRRIFDQVPGVELMAAMQGRLGLDLAREHQPDLILLDLYLPDMRGEQVLEALREDESTSEIPVFIVSDEAFPEQIEKLRREGASEYFSKPIDVRQLLRSVRATLLNS